MILRPQRDCPKWRQARREERSLVIQMNDEQRSVAPFWASPGGPAPFSRKTALPLIHVAMLHHIRGALSCEKTALGAVVEGS